MCLLDALLPRPVGAGARSVWDLPSSKVKTAAVAFTFTICAGYISLLAAGGLVAILVTGIIVTIGVLLTVLICTGLVTVLVTGLPLGYGVWRMMEAGAERRASSRSSATRYLW